MSAHWGEIPSQPDTESGIAAIEREQITKPRPIEVEGPTLHQPSRKQLPASTEVHVFTAPQCVLPKADDRKSMKLPIIPMTASSAPLDLFLIVANLPAKQDKATKGLKAQVRQWNGHPADAFAIDAETLHTIKLIQYSRRLRAMIISAQQHIETIKSGEVEFLNFPPTPSIPEYSGKAVNHKPQKPIPFLRRDCERPFTRGIGQSPPEIDSRTNRKLLRRSVSAICAHAGFDNCSESILETMTDICNEYFLQITQLLRRAVDNEARYGSTGFADPVDQVFHEMGIGSPVVLHDFYQNRILNYHQNMQKTCEKLRDEYDRIRSPENRPMEDLKPSIKEEPLSDIQFPILDEGDENGDTEQVLHLEGLGLEINIVNDSSTSMNTEDDSQKWSHSTVKQEPCDLKPRKPRPYVPPPLVIPPSIALSHVKKKLYEKVFSKRAGVNTLESFDQEDPHNSTDPLSSVPSTPVMGSVPHTPGGDSVGNPGSVSVSDIMSPPSTGMRKPPKKKKKK